ncbi:MAG: 3-hydroxyacyl-CoA dehydrogenase family protein [Acidobacteriota bacterium]
MTSESQSIRTLAVIGAGQMGAQIAIQAALHDVDVRLHDVVAGHAAEAIAANRTHLERRVEKGKLTADARDRALARLRPCDALDDACAGVDLVIEAVVEDLDVKRAVFAELDRLTPASAILATNSSYIGSSELVDAAPAHAGRVLNLHFFYPPLVMRLVEVVRNPSTDDAVVAASIAFVRAIDRVPVVLRKEVPGFLVNRILRAITNEAYDLLEQGVASFADIDQACELGLNHPLGPFRLSDLSGLDIGYRNRQARHAATGDPADRPPAALARRVERGDLGRKTGRGFYDYATRPPRPTED